MSSLNRATIIGNLGQDPETRHTAGGNAVTNLSVATSERWKDKGSGQQQERVEWHRVSAFGKLAEIMGQYLTKGSKVYIDGRIQTRKWQGKDGQDRYTTEIVAQNMIMLDGKREAASTGGSGQPSGGLDDDIPFAPLKGREFMA